MHHICSTQLHFPSKDELQFSLESHRAISNSSSQKKIIDIFADAFANKQRSPRGLRWNIHLLLDTYKNEILPESPGDILKLFTTVLTDIAKEYTSRHHALSL